MGRIYIGEIDTQRETRRQGKRGEPNIMKYRKNRIDMIHKARSRKGRGCIIKNGKNRRDR